MNRQLLYLLVALVLIVAAPFVLPFPLSLLRTEGFMPPRVAPFALAEPRMAEPRSILVQEAFEDTLKDATVPTTVDKPVVSVSDTAYDAMTLKQRSDLLKGVQQMVREEIRAARTQPLSSTDSSASLPPADSAASSDSTASRTTSAIQQGQDYQRRCEKDQGQGQGQDEYRCPKNPDGSCPPVPDLSQYIRKDQIPCWGCAVD